MDLGTYLEYDGRPAIRFERTYPHPIERVWSAITDPVELAAWFPSSVQMDSHVDGTIRFSDDPHLENSTGRILAYDPPRRLGYTWGGDELHFWITSTDSGCTLTLINVLEARDTASRNATGWTVCLEELDKHITGRPRTDPQNDSAIAFEPIYQEYIDSGMPYGAVIPGYSH